MNATLNINSTGVKVDIQLPSICPLCNKGIKPVIIDYVQDTVTPFSTNKEITCLEVICKCPACNNMIWAEYYKLPDIGYTLINIYPTNDNIQLDIPKELNSLYPNFYRIYTQAAKAENSKLDEICGLGYRKSIEFLVKEYAIHKSPSDETAIKKESLGSTINNRIDNTQIKDLAKIASWLGNDHAHMVNKHEEFDIKSMKAFISALANFIVFEHRAEEAAKIVGSSTEH